ncbi:ATP-binding cassette domain-containing protein [Pseudomonas sp. LD120]|uniref:ATP-binding cassette domain-containing protein n=1 Tax=Pseudomonas sp. LD120 TaxID=485751 RepID=UPI001356FC12|nr:ATP-binding cassette domain-containing protein [Pseudomonas sp. LD120]KAF0866422.1 ATP-binding cassette domain-containing protein [Pseudomonas sp. LD120]
MSALATTVEAVELVKRFRTGAREQLALDGVSLKVPSGQLSALVGPDGAGKTTLLRMIAGLLKADAGQLKVLGLDVGADPQQVQDLISYMPQKFGLYEDLTIQENLELYADLHGVQAQQRQERFSRLLQMMDLTRFRDRLAGQLSGGMKQKLGLACTLVRSPQLLLLDEPTVGVDPLSRRELWSIIEQLIEQENLTVLISTAYMDEAQSCAQVFVLYQGRLIAQGPPAQLCELAQGLCYGAGPQPGTPARLLQARLLDDSEHVIDAVPEGGKVRFIRSARVPIEDIPSLTGLAPPQALEARLEDGFMVLLRQQVASVATPDESLWVPTSDHQGDSAVDRRVVIEVRDLVRKFGDFTAVASTSFEVLKGEIFGLLGPNGAGKTTTFRMLCGLLPASSGHLEVAGVNLRHARAAARRKIGYVSQKFALYANLSALENLRFFGGVYGLHGGQLKARVALMLEQFDLEEHQHLRSGELPGGYKQRLAMAVALLHEPQILFLDEPTSGIDPLARRAFWRRITALAQSGTTIVITTHFMEEAEYCDRIVIQDAGRLLALGTPEQVRQQGDESLADMNSAFIAVVERARARASVAAQ